MDIHISTSSENEDFVHIHRDWKTKGHLKFPKFTWEVNFYIKWRILNNFSYYRERERERDFISLRSELLIFILKPAKQVFRSSSTLRRQSFLRPPGDSPKRIRNPPPSRFLRKKLNYGGGAATVPGVAEERAARARRLVQHAGGALSEEAVASAYLEIGSVRCSRGCSGETHVASSHISYLVGS